MSLNAPRTYKPYALLILTVITLAVWSVTLQNGFVYDDNWFLLGNPWIKDIRFIPDIFASSTMAFDPASAPSNTYRPMLYMLYMAEYHLFGTDPTGFHAVNILIHMANALLVFFIARRLFEIEGNDWKSFLPPVLAALVFSLHTVNSEVVNWVSAKTELSFTFFVLAALLMHLKNGNASLWRAAVSCGCFFAALLFKETAAVLPAVVFAFDISRLGTGARRHWKEYLFYGAAFVVYFTLRISALGGVMHHKQVELSLAESLINVFPLIAAYFGKLLVPVNLNALYEFHPVRSASELKVLAGIGALVLFISAAFLARRRPSVFTGLSLIILPLLPVLYVPALSSAAFADRYLYLPSAGFAMIMAMVFMRAMKQGRSGVFAIVIAGFVLICYGAGSVQRSMAWRSDYTLWGDTVRKSPYNSNAHYNFAWACQSRGETKAAVEHYLETIRLAPNSADAHYNLGGIYASQRMIDSAIKEYRAVLVLNPANGNARQKLAELTRMKETAE